VFLQVPAKTVQLFRDLGVIYKTSHDSYPGADSPNWMPDAHTITLTSPSRWMLSSRLSTLERRLRVRVPTR